MIIKHNYKYSNNYHLDHLILFFSHFLLQAEDVVVERKMLKKNLIESLLIMLDRTFSGTK